MIPMIEPSPHEPSLYRVALWLCSLCIDGVGGECHVPGCAFWLNRAPDLPLTDHLEFLPAEGGGPDAA